MKILTHWLRSLLPALAIDDRQLADDLTLRGIAVEGVHSLGVGNGHLFEMDITTNRVDAMNHYGIAREAATIYDLPLPPLTGTLTTVPSATAFPVRIDAPQLCGRFTAQVLRDVILAPSRGEVADRFALLGQKLISNAVDASNFTLLGMGHPTHAFDLDKIEGGIIVRLARPGERLKLLDGTERVLEGDDLVVADEHKALALAGVMGGWDSMITPATKNVLVEAAWFDPASVRRSSRRHLLHTDASHRFERGADFNAAPIANALVSQLILSYGGWAEGSLIDIVSPDAQAKTALRLPVALSVRQVQRHLGTTHDPQGISTEIVARYLSALGCKLDLYADDTFAVTLPSWRLDLDREIDLIEEVARVYGYNRFANTLPAPGIVIAHPLAAKEAAVRARLLALGYSEAISGTFASQADGELFGASGKGTVAMENPLSEEATLLRPSLMPGMLAMLGHNLNRDVREVRLFEQGQVFTGSTEAVEETGSLSLGLTGTVQGTFLYKEVDAPFYGLKGAVESLVSLFDTRGDALTFTTESAPWLQPGRSASATLGTARIAAFGELSAGQSAQRKLRQSVWLAEIDLARLYALPLRTAMAQELSRFQAVERDFSFTFPDATGWASVELAIRSLGIVELVKLSPVEIFRDAKGKSVPAGSYALLLRCVFQSQERTLGEEELTGWWSAIIVALTALGGTIRAPESAVTAGKEQA